MKVVGINGSVRKDGNTALMIRMVFEELEKEGIETELIQLGQDWIPPCRGCMGCRGNKNCVFTDDKFCEYFQKLLDADVIILGSPVYSADVTANLKAFMERAGIVVSTNRGIFRHKVAAAVAAVRRGGAMPTVDSMNHFLLNKEVYLVGSNYWNMGFGRNIGEFLNDEEGVRNMHNLGENMAWLLKKICE